MAELNNTVKTRRPSDAPSTSGAAAKKQRVNTKTEITNKGVTIEIVPIGHPNIKLSPDELNSIKNYILTSIPFAPENGCYPQFDDVRIRIDYGKLLINCLDEKTVKWLQQVCTEVTLKETTGIKVVKKKANIIEGRFPAESSSIWAILNLMCAQNPGIHKQDWNFIKMEQRDQETIIKFSIVGQSLETLRAKNFKLCYKFSSVSFTMLKDKSVNEGGDNSLVI